MLSGPGALPLASFLRLLSKISFVKFFASVVFLGPLVSMMKPSCPCHGYLRTAQ